MNDKFENLMYHAGMAAQGCWDEMDSYQREALERLALLIVRECAEVAGCNGHVSGFTLGDLIKEHFGVKE